MASNFISRKINENDGDSDSDCELGTITSAPPKKSVFDIEVDSLLESHSEDEGIKIGRSMFKFKFDNPTDKGEVANEFPKKTGGYIYDVIEAIKNLKKKPYMHETFNGPCVAYFDIDIGNPSSNTDGIHLSKKDISDKSTKKYNKIVFDTVKKVFKKSAYPKRKIYIAQSHGRAVKKGEKYYKLSWHVVVRGVGLYKNAQSVKIRWLSIMDEELEKISKKEDLPFKLCCDKGVYKDKQNLRTIGSSKLYEGTGREMIPIVNGGESIIGENEDEDGELIYDQTCFANFLVSNVNGEKAWEEGSDEGVKKSKKKKEKKESKRPMEENVIIKEIIEDVGQDEEQIFKLLNDWMQKAHPNSEPEKDPEQLADYPDYKCFTFKNTTKDECLICEREHQSNRNYIIWNAVKRIAYYKCQSSNADADRDSKSRSRLLIFGSSASIADAKEVIEAIKRRKRGLADLYLSKRKRYVVFTGDCCGYIYRDNDKLWTKFEHKSVIEQDIFDTLEPMFISANKIGDTSGKLTKYTEDLQDAQLIVDILRIAIAKLIDYDFETRDWKNHHLFPIRDGKVFNIKTKQLEDRLPEHGFTYFADVEYINDVNQQELGTQKVVQFIRNIAGARDDLKLPGSRHSLVNFIQDMLGYCMTGEVNMRIFFLLQGSGQNGKSILDNIFAKMMGSFSTTAAAKVFVEKKNDPVHDAALVPLMHGRCVVINELKKNQVFDMSLIKQWSGFDKITVRGCGSKKTNEFRPRSKLMMKTNCIPEWKNVEDDEEDFRAFEDRMCVVPFDVRFVKTITNPGNQIMADDALIRDIEEKYMSHFFSWCLEGAMRYYDNDCNIDIPEIVKAKKKQVLNDKDIILQYAETCICTCENEIKTSAKEIWEDWGKWDDCDKKITNIQFAKRFAAIFPDKRTKERGYNVYYGICPKSTLPDQTKKNDDDVIDDDE